MEKRMVLRIVAWALAVVALSVAAELVRMLLGGEADLVAIAEKLVRIGVVVVAARTVTALIVVVWRRIDERANKRKLPLDGLAQLAKGVVWIVAVIVAAGIAVGRSPAALLTGLGAFSAVMMLVFKNNILSVVAGVQLSENDSLHVGDWIKVAGTSVNGIVEEVSLVSVKVRNWDKTTTTLPPYSLISTGFTNYRSMQRSNTRLIDRSVPIDADSVKRLTAELAERIAMAVPMTAGLDGDETNLGLFRRYVKLWLDGNEEVAHDSECFVSTLPQGESGVPLRVYCFAATSVWSDYESTQSAIFEHIAVTMRDFELWAFENPSSRGVFGG